MMLDADLIAILRARLADKFTAYELVEMLDIPVEDIIEMYLDQIMDNKEIMNAVH